jgi:Na+-transporting NADH:ubiquinone oxidoreductase subunit NqrF
MKRRFATIATLTLSLALGSAVLLSAGPAAAGDDKCTIAVKGNSLPAKACAKGGRKEARTVMKEMVAKAKTKGVNYACENCHQDLTTNNYDLTKDALENYKKLQAASGMK